MLKYFQGFSTKKFITEKSSIIEAIEMYLRTMATLIIEW